MEDLSVAGFTARLTAKAKELAALLSGGSSDGVTAAQLAAVSEELARLTLQGNLDSLRVQQHQQRIEEQAREWKKTTIRLREQSSRDSLTGLNNRSFFMGALQAELRRAYRRFEVLGTMFLDLDGFKPLNDRFGHAFGDRVLKEVALTLQNNLRATDVLARFGGDEFCVFLPNTPETALPKIGDRLVQAIGKMGLPGGRQFGSLGVSIGIAFCLPYSSLIATEQVVSAADQAMYDSKSAGKNRITIRSLLSEGDRKLIAEVEQRTFRTFLFRRQLLAPDRINEIPATRVVKPCLQRIARGLGWITSEDARTLIGEQRVHRQRFCDLALARSLLDAEQMWTLLAIQQEPPEQLANRLLLAEAVDAAAMESALADYYRDKNKLLQELR